MTEQGPSSAPPERPNTLVFVAVAVGGLGIGFGIAATILMLRSRPPESTAAALPSAVASSGAATPGRPEAPEAPEQEWTALLRAAQCDAPCCGGSACAVAPQNAAKNRCRPDAEHCDECASALTCIPGACGAMLGYGEEFELHLSGIVERGPAGEPVDSCRSRRDLWLCVRRKDEASWQCLPQREACSNRARSPAGIPIASDDLLRSGLEIEVREDGPDGATLARRDSLPYREGLQRRGMCGGFKLSFDGSSISAFTYFLDAPSEGGPEPTIVPVRADAGSGAPSDAAGAPALPSAALTEALSPSVGVAPSAPAGALE